MNLPLLYLRGFAILTVFCWMPVATNSLLAKEIDPLNKTLRLAVIYVEEPPYIYTDDMSEYVGIVPKLAQALSRELELDLTYLPTPRKGLEQSVIDERADMTWLSPDWVVEKESLLFSNPILSHKEFLYSFSPFSDGGPADWLQDKTVCIRQDYQYPSLMPFFEQNIAQAMRVSNQVSPITLWQKGRCDVLYMSENRAAWMISSLGITRKVWRSKYPLDETQVSFVFNQKWQEKMTEINQALRKIIDSGELNVIVQSNIDPTILSNVTID